VLLIRRGTSYRTEANTLIAMGLRSAEIDLRSVRIAHPVLWSPWTAGKSYQYLVIEIDSYRLRLGDSKVRCYFQPDGLRALVDGLNQAADPQVRDNAQWLRPLADQPDVSSWPLPRRPAGL
jgi:hypothetical protein